MHNPQPVPMFPNCDISPVKELTRKGDTNLFGVIKKTVTMVNLSPKRHIWVFGQTFTAYISQNIEVKSKPKKGQIRNQHKIRIQKSIHL